VVSGAEPVRIAFDWREWRMQTVDWGKQHLKNFIRPRKSVRVFTRSSATADGPRDAMC